MSFRFGQSYKVGLSGETPHISRPIRNFFQWTKQKRGVACNLTSLSLKIHVRHCVIEEKYTSKYFEARAVLHTYLVVFTATVTDVVVGVVLVLNLSQQNVNALHTTHYTLHTTHHYTLQTRMHMTTQRFPTLGIKQLKKKNWKFRPYFQKFHP